MTFVDQCKVECRPILKIDGKDVVVELWPFNRYLCNNTIFLCQSQARTWISNVICRGLFLCSV